MSTAIRDLHFAETLIPFSAMQSEPCEIPATARPSPTRPSGWMHRVMTLLDAAIGQLHHEQPAHGTLLAVSSLLRSQADPLSTPAADAGKERLLAWQARKVLDYIDSHIGGRVLVADLCALVWRSEAHFSRSFKATFGRSPHAFLIRRRVELAAKRMLETDLSLSDIALGCGFADHAHLCKHFRAVIGETPSAWRRASGGAAFSAQLPLHAAPAQSRPRALAVDTA